MSEEQSAKRLRRGIRFPMYSLREALRVAQEVQNSGGGELDIESLAIALSLSPKASGFIVRISSATHFGLLEREDGRVRTTKVAKSILRPLNEDEKMKGLKEAVFHFDIFKELYEKYAGGKLPQTPILENILTREYGISDISKKNACNVFLDSIKFAGLAEEVEGGSLICIEKTVEQRTPQSIPHAERGPARVPHRIDARLADLIRNIGSLKVIFEFTDDIKDKEREYLKQKSIKIVEDSFALASDIGLAATKMSLKIMKDMLGKEDIQILQNYYTYVEEGLKEDLGLEKSNGDTNEPR